VAVDLVLVVALWKELKLTSFDPEFAQTVRISPKLLSRLLLIAVAITAVTAFESVGAILVVTLLIVPAATARLLTDRLWLTVALAVAVGWVCAIGGYGAAVGLDASIAGAMGLVAAVCFVVAFVARWLVLERRSAARA
jgi:manganese/zinc/iron transport system permease protein